ncbi:hypothetical protein, partial [Escherichia coli]
NTRTLPAPVTGNGLFNNVYRPVEKVVLVLADEPDDEYESDRDEYLNHSLDILEQNRRKKAI